MLRLGNIKIGQLVSSQSIGKYSYWSAGEMCPFVRFTLYLTLFFRATTNSHSRALTSIPIIYEYSGLSFQRDPIHVALLLIFSSATGNDRVGRTKPRVKLSSLEKEMYVDTRCNSTRTYIIIIFSRHRSHATLIHRPHMRLEGKTINLVHTIQC